MKTIRYILFIPLALIASVIIGTIGHWFEEIGAYLLGDIAGIWIFKGSAFALYTIKTPVTNLIKSEIC